MNEETAETVETTEGEAEGTEAAKIEAPAKVEPGKAAPSISDKDKEYIQLGKLAAARDLVNRALTKYGKAAYDEDNLIELAEKLVRNNASEDTLESRIYAEARRYEDIFKKVKARVEETVSKEQEAMKAKESEAEAEAAENLGRPITGGGTASNVKQLIDEAKSEDEVIKVLKETNVPYKI